MGRIWSALLGLFLLSLSGLSATLSGGPSRSSLPAPVQVPAAPAPTESRMLSLLLAMAADYCDRLSRASIDFVCLEEVKETVFENQPYVRPSPHGRPEWRDGVVTHNYLYDYQFIVENGQKTEKRRILELDGLKQKGEDTDLDTRTFYYKNVMFGAVDLLAGSRQSFYRYELKGREVQDGQAVAVIDAVPIPGLGIQINQGTIWLRESDAAILKIVWNVRSMETSAAILETAKELKGAPQILQVTEFGLEKNGVRFPNRFHIEEAYINKKGKKKVRSAIDAEYRDYKFFTVEVETGTIKRP